ncbi:DNA-processing protein DprA [Ferrimonas sp. SCSIO 43195]|uniref:DNA-processing protein DprA n=1 Tax=Ferrimonas sp. SCSIO 43195 TaxID=2822844 RepID=UPI0020760AA3|nr:DNA-processing protein DprA [Ferrimonas sp. SCSIO 43195]USD37591.1 DNA-processing protein DprA [Ferrimonas sp. SCSIO 43195]
MPNTLTDWAALMMAPRLGLMKTLSLLQLASPSVLRQWALAGDLPGVSPATAQQLGYPNMARIDALLAWAEQPGQHILPLDHPDYPQALKQIADPPLMLFVQGQLAALQGPALAMVGSRRATVAAKERTLQWAEQLASLGWVIVSGLAEGVDAQAHRGALRSGFTVAVVGSGLNHCYPRIHTALAEQIRERGAMVSSFLPWQRPRREFFPQRNRIVSGLSYGTVVMEAGIKSGSLITARLAAEQGREVFAVPGSVDNPGCEGGHYLIKQGAKLVDDPVDIYEELLPMGVAPAIEPVVKAGSELPLPKLLDSVGYEATPVDVVVARSDLPVDVVLEQLLMLELEGRIAQVSGGYIRLRGG